MRRRVGVPERRNVTFRLTPGSLRTFWPAARIALSTFAGFPRPKGHEPVQGIDDLGVRAMKKKWILVSAIGITLVGAGVVLASRNGKEKPASAAESLPFRLGTVTAEDLQVSVREVGVVDPVTKVDVKSVVSGRLVKLHVREGAVVKAGDVLAEVEPDVTQAQSLSEVSAAVSQAELGLKDAERQLRAQQASGTPASSGTRR
jgi:Membrane-fusion protein